jgi:hypothetical protein
MTEHISNTCAGFCSGYFGVHGIQPTQQVIWDAAMRSFVHLYPNGFKPFGMPKTAPGGTAPGGVQWKPIGTAPKDNARLLILARLDDEGRILQIDYDATWEFWQESWEMAHINGIGWCSANGIEEPTHWEYQ